MAKVQEVLIVINHDKDDETSYVSLKLNGLNFQTSKKTMEAHFCGIDKVSYVDGSITKPLIKANNYLKWKIMNGLITYILYKSMNKDVS